MTEVLARLRPGRVLRGLKRRAKALLQPATPVQPVETEAQGERVARVLHLNDSQHWWAISQTIEQLSGRKELGEFRIGPNEGLQYRRDAVYRRDRNAYLLDLPAFHYGSTLDKAGQLGPAYLYWFMNCPPEVEFMSVTLSDGDAPSAARFSPSTNQAQMVPIPDPYFFTFNGFESWARLADERDVPWHERTDPIVWRGSSSGEGTFDPVLGRQWPARATARLQLILAAQSIPGVDVALSGYTRDEVSEAVMRKHGVLRESIPEDSWLARKFAIDVDGQTNTWSNLLIRMHLGCCVLKVASRHGYRQWYYDRLIPWEHYAPVSADCSDLAERVEWVRSNDGQAKEIAENGRRFARSLTFEAVQREAVELITNNWNKSS